MPKVKTNSTAKKKIKITGSGKLMRKQANKRHILTKKETKRKRHLTGFTTVSDADSNNMKHLLRNRI